MRFNSLQRLTIISGGKRARPLATVQPLATDLGLTVDTFCEKDDADCVADLVTAWDANGNGTNVLICWEHDNLSLILEAMGDSNPPDYPDDSYVTQMEIAT